MSLSRRSFLGGVMAAIAASTLPLDAVAASTPVLYGDGIHDDTEALQAIFDGKPVRIARDEIAYIGAASAEIVGGHFVISDTIHIRAGGPAVRMERNHIAASPSFPEGRPMMHFHDRAGVIDRGANSFHAC